MLDYDGRFIWVLRQGGGSDLYRLDDQRPEDLRDSLSSYRYWIGEGSGSGEHVFLWTGETLSEIDVRVGEFILRDTLHSLDALNYP
jgi:hypothetical protein